jgi:hypothetical protein
LVFALAACSRSTLGELDAALTESADTHDAYWCKYGEPAKAPCFDCSGASFAGCHEGVICRRECKEASDCPAPGPGGSSVPECVQTDGGGECILYCGGEKGDCPDGMKCADRVCFYMFQDFKTCAGGP